MSITKERKNEIINKYGDSKTDSGDTGVQIAILTERINNITEHLKSNKKDYSGQRGLIKLVSQRRKLSKYLTKIDPNKYEELRNKLGLIK